MIDYEQLCQFLANSGVDLSKIPFLTPENNSMTKHALETGDSLQEACAYALTVLIMAYDIFT